MAHYNTIQVARGSIAAKTTCAYGELFYDTASASVYIGQSTGKFKRIGGFSSVVLKGAITALPDLTTIANVDDYDAGSAYIVTADIKVGTVKVFKAGQIIVYSGDATYCDSKYNTATTNDLNGAYNGWIPLSGSTSAEDVDFDNSDAPTAQTPTAITTVQDALTNLFNTRCTYIGPTATYMAIGKDIATVFASLLVGQFTLYTGDTTGLISKNTLVLNQNGTFYTIPLGTSDASQLDYNKKGTRKSTETLDKVSSINKLGETITLTTDAGIVTTQNALDSLFQTKADLNSNGKIPVSQIPQTLVGALQYIGTYSYAGTAGTAITNADLATALANIKGGMETSSEGTAADNLYNTLDAGDYYIVSGSSFVLGDYTATTTDGVTVWKDSSGAVVSNDVIAAATYNAGDWIIVQSTSDTAVVFDRLNASASVDNVNGRTGAVLINGNTRTVDSATLVETAVSATASDGSAITVTAPNAVLENAEVATDQILKASTGKGAVDSGITATTTAGVTSVTADAHKVDWATEAGKMAVVATGEGTENVLPKFDAAAGLQNSSVQDNGTKLTIGGIELNYSDLANLFKYIDETASTRTLRFDSADAARTTTAARTAADAAVHTILDDCSVVDGGEWTA